MPFKKKPVYDAGVYVCVVDCYDGKRLCRADKMDKKVLKEETKNPIMKHFKRVDNLVKKDQLGEPAPPPGDPNEEDSILD